MIDIYSQLIYSILVVNLLLLIKKYVFNIYGMKLTFY